jgi:hypothetical protein
MGLCPWDVPVSWNFRVNLLHHSHRNWLSARSGQSHGRWRSGLSALGNDLDLVRYSVLLSHVVGLGLGVFSIAWLVVDFLDSGVRYWGSDPGGRRLGIREVVVRVGGF